MNITDPKLLTDLEIDDRVIPSLDHTITVYGKTKFKELFRMTLYDPNALTRRREIIQSIIDNGDKRQHIKKMLRKIKRLEGDIEWLFSSPSPSPSPSESSHKKEECNDLYFRSDTLNMKELLTVSNSLKVINPGLLLFIYLLIYSIFRYTGHPLDIKMYVKTVYTGYQSFVKMLLSLFIKDQNLVSFVGNILANTYAIYQLYSIFSSFETAISHWGKCKDVKERFDRIRTVIECIKTIYRKDVFLGEKRMLKPFIQDIDKLFEGTSLGSILVLKRNAATYEEKFNRLLQYTGLIDSFISVSSLYTNYGFTFPTFDFRKEGGGPYVDIQDVRSPCYHNMGNQVLNNCALGLSRKENPRTMIITGPNTSGKSTYIRNVALSIFLSQTIGMSCCKSITFTPFDNIFTYIDIPNIERNKESLFEAEINRCSSFCKILERESTTSYSFTIMDELFTGTSPQEGISGSYAVCEYLGQFPNSLLIVTTHFKELTKLESQYPSLFKNKRFSLGQNRDGTFDRSYLIEDGVSDQNVAIELLQQKGYNSQIIDRAIQRMNSIGTSYNGDEGPNSRMSSKGPNSRMSDIGPNTTSTSGKGLSTRASDKGPSTIISTNTKEPTYGININLDDIDTIFDDLRLINQNTSTVTTNRPGTV